MNQIGDVLTRKRGKGTRRICIVGIRNDCYVVTAADAFEPPYEISPLELAEQFGGSPAPVEPVDENAAWQSMDRNWLDGLNRQIRAKEQTAEPLLTPEQSLALAEKG